jgi:hypothetical protein
MIRLITISPIKTLPYFLFLSIKLKPRVKRTTARYTLQDTSETPQKTSLKNKDNSSLCSATETFYSQEFLTGTGQHEIFNIHCMVLRLMGSDYDEILALVY